MLAVHYSEVDCSRNHKFTEKNKREKTAGPQEWLIQEMFSTWNAYFSSASKKQYHLDTVSISVLLQQC